VIVGVSGKSGAGKNCFAEKLMKMEYTLHDTSCGFKGGRRYLHGHRTCGDNRRGDVLKRGIEVI